MTDLLDFPVSLTKPVPDGPVLEFKVNRGSLDKALGAVASVVPSKDLIPVLKNVHLKVLGSDLKVSASDSVLSAVSHCSLYATQYEGSAVLPAARLIPVVREAEGEYLHVKVVSKKQKMTAVLKSEHATWQFPLVDGSAFPDFSTHEDIGTTPINREKFLSALQMVRKAVSTDTMRPYLMLVDVSKGRMRASDSIRFQQVNFDFPLDCQIPARAVQELVSRLSTSNLEQVEVGQTDTALLFRFDKTLLIAQKLSVKFPDMDEVLLTPAMTNDQELKVSRSALLSAIRRARITADEETAGIVLSLNSGSVSVECRDRKGGVTVETVTAEWHHPPRHISFNHQALSDMLSSTKAEDCLFLLGKDLKTKPTPLVMESKKEDFLAVLSQIRLDWL